MSGLQFRFRREGRGLGGGFTGSCYGVRFTVWGGYKLAWSWALTTLQKCYDAVFSFRVFEQGVRICVVHSTNVVSGKHAENVKQLSARYVRQVLREHLIVIIAL